VKIQSGNLSKGYNQIGVDVIKLTSGIYHLTVSWNNGEMQKATRLVKQ